MTTIVDLMPKPQLAGWAARIAAEYAVANPGATLADIKGAPTRLSKEAAARGTAVHAAMVSGQWTPDIAAYRPHARRFLRDYEFAPVWQEGVVWSKSGRYAGTFDALGYVRGRLTLLDWKTTNSGAWPAHRIQLAAYRNTDDLKKLPIAECAIVWLRPDGYEYLPQKVGREEWEYFMRLRKNFDWS